MRITVLTYVEEEGGRELDPVVAQVASALRRRKHQVSTLAVHGDARKLIAGLSRRKPDLVFNLVEEFGEDPAGNISIAGLLDLLRYKYTGCGPGEFYLGQDKGLAKKLLAYENIRYPEFAVFSRDQDFEIGGNLRMPLFVKPVAQDASLGIDRMSLVTSSSELMERVAAIREEFDDGALAEEFIDGREFYVGVLGNLDPQALPPLEADFSGLPEGRPRVYDRSAKWGPGAAEPGGVKVAVADLADDLRARLQKASLDAYRALRVRDYGRVDLRMAETGDIYVLEVNASCYLEKTDEFAMAAQAAGIKYPDLVQRIVELAAERYGM
jgi:D-alanine-D-alanine ligase